MTVPQTRYTSLGEADIAYQVLGEGPLDLVYVNGLTEHIDLQWDHPLMARFLERLASFSRLIMFDRRGAGASDPVPLDALPTWEEWAEDLRAVLDAVGSERAAIYAELDAGPVGMIFAGDPSRAHLRAGAWQHCGALCPGGGLPGGGHP
jgi:pimeloyl-ACP methyl ester carboxylesterase